MFLKGWRGATKSKKTVKQRMFHVKHEKKRVKSTSGALKSGKTSELIAKKHEIFSEQLRQSLNEKKCKSAQMHAASADFAFLLFDAKIKKYRIYYQKLPFFAYSGDFWAIFSFFCFFK